MKHGALLMIKLGKYQNSDENLSLIIFDYCILVEALRGLAFCIVQKLMPDFALTFRNGAVATKAATKCTSGLLECPTLRDFRLYGSSMPGKYQRTEDCEAVDVCY